MVNKADPSVFVSADDVRDSGGPSSPAATVDSPRQSTASPGKPSTSADDNAPSVAFADSAADDDQPPSNEMICLLPISSY